VTWRLAARYADELNVVYLSPEEVDADMPTIRSRCEEIGRDPATLKVSLYCRDDDVRESGQARVDFIGRCSEIGLSRLVAFPTRWDPTVDTQASFAADCRAAGIELAVKPNPASTPA
jgi:alkanesulfonate monooxygenase SsuD/methylene tetrahydromethanopterin reductase-like flavin-dependent oxidoreductase (luciferase family)